METLILILGLLYILSFGITLAFGIDQCRQGAAEWYYYPLTVFLAAIWPLVGYWMADRLHKETTGSVQF